MYFVFGMGGASCGSYTNMSFDIFLYVKRYLLAYKNMSKDMFSSLRYWQSPRRACVMPPSSAESI